MSSLIYVLVGRPESHKRNIANSIVKYHKGLYTRLKPYVKEGVASDKPHRVMSAAEYEHIIEGNIFYEVPDKYVILKSQFSNHNVVLVVNDPGVVDKVAELGIPFAVAYVDCPEDVIYSTALNGVGYAKANEIRKYNEETRSVMQAFEESGCYSFYIDTSRIKVSEYDTVVTEFCEAAEKWQSFEGDLHPGVHMPYIGDYFRDNLRKCIKAKGYYVCSV